MSQIFLSLLLAVSAATVVVVRGPKDVEQIFVSISSEGFTDKPLPGYRPMPTTKDGTVNLGDIDPTLTRLFITASGKGMVGNTIIEVQADGKFPAKIEITIVPRDAERLPAAGAP